MDEKNNLTSLLRDFAQATSNSVASNAAVPVDVLAWLLRKGGVNVPSNPVMGSDWLAERGFTRDVKSKAAGLAGDIAGMVLPFAGVTKAPQIAKGLLGMGENLAKPNAMPNAGQRGAIVWHGSPHKFPPTPNNPLGEFDFTKIGTGEGAQAYGHGGYLGGVRETGEEYRRALAGKDKGMAGSIAADALKGSTPDAAISDLMASMRGTTKENQLVTQEAIDLIKSGNANNGYLYKVDLPDEHIAKMLDWDKPLSQQAPHIQSAIEKTKSMLPPNAMDDLGGDLSLMYGRDVKPEQFLNTWESFGNKAGGENALQSLGIPGIKYLDGGSRGAGQGSSNYVVFPGNERLLKILERNGESVAPKPAITYHASPVKLDLKDRYGKGYDELYDLVNGEASNTLSMDKYDAFRGLLSKYEKGNLGNNAGKKADELYVSNQPDAWKSVQMDELNVPYDLGGVYGLEVKQAPSYYMQKSGMGQQLPEAVINAKDVINQHGPFKTKAELDKYLYSIGKL